MLRAIHVHMSREFRYRSSHLGIVEHKKGGQTKL